MAGHVPDEPETQPHEPRKSFITPEMIKKNPVLAAGVFAGDPAWDEIIGEINKHRERKRRREQRVEN
jgi:hypothetical protein